MSEGQIAEIADAIEHVTIERQGQGLCLITGRNDSEAFARAALSVIEGRVRAEERERAARIAEGKYRDHPAASVRAVNYRHAARVIAAAIRSGDEG